MRKLRSTLVLLVVLVVVLAAAPPAQAANKVEDLLNQVGISYNKVEEGLYKAVVQVDDKSEVVLFRQTNVGNDPNDESLKLIQAYVLVANFPETTKPSAAALAKIVAVNSDMTVGKLVVMPGAVMYVSTFWYKSCTPEQFALESILAVYNAGGLKGQIKPFFEE